MRITGGILAGRIFNPPASHWPTRPTTDIAREALFNILSNFMDFDRTRMLDLFGGSGAHSYEMASRGCVDITYVDKFPPCLNFVNKMIKEFDLGTVITTVLSDYERFILKNDLEFNYTFKMSGYRRPIGA
jgi:16S rRNA (guanine966-N2)-methyltransferase